MRSSEQDTTHSPPQESFSDAKHMPPQQLHSSTTGRREHGSDGGQVTSMQSQVTFTSVAREDGADVTRVILSAYTKNNTTTTAT